MLPSALAMRIQSLFLAAAAALKNKMHKEHNTWKTQRINHDRSVKMNA